MNTTKILLTVGGLVVGSIVAATGVLILASSALSVATRTF